MKAIILAGGGGARLWPVSRKKNPKQTAPVVGADTMLGTAYARARSRFAPSDILVATGAAEEATVRGILPELPPENLLLEPHRRDTAAAIGYAVTKIAHVDPEETFVVMNSDAYIRDPEGYLRAIAAAGAAVSLDPSRPVLICVNPTYPETGYGYLKSGAEAGNVDMDGTAYEVRTVDRFVEKPDLATAEFYLKDGTYFWNPTLIVAKAGEFLKLYARFLPDHAALFSRMQASFGTATETDEVAECFKRLPSISIDYGILEKAELKMITAEFGWADIGNWRSVHDILTRGGEGNVVKGTHIDVGSENCFIMSSSGKLIATAGLKDMIVIDTGDAVLVCPRDKAQDVKRIVAELERDGSLKDYL
jgi:mannose-1-phosphate guanylyltransferase